MKQTVTIEEIRTTVVELTVDEITRLIQKATGISGEVEYHIKHGDVLLSATVTSTVSGRNLPDGLVQTTEVKKLDI